MAVSSGVFAAEDGETMSESEINAIVDSAFDETSQAASTSAILNTFSIDGNGNIVAVSGDEDDDTEKVYRYEGKKIFDESIMPKRSFNNIPYPY